MTQKVLIATRLYPPEVGAAAFRLEALADGLLDAGASVAVLTSVPPSSSKPVVSRVPVSRWPVLRDAGGNVRGYVQYLSFDLPLFFRLLASRADVVVSEPPPTTGLMVALSSWLRRRPYVYYAADVWTDALAAMGAPGLLVALMRSVEGLALRRAARVIAISHGVAEQLAQFRVDPTRVSMVGNGVNTDTFTPDGETSDPGHPYFVYTGTMSEWQGAEVFIRAMEHLDESSPVRLYFFGQGSAESDLRALAERVAPGRVEFGGVIAPQETAVWIRGAVASLVSIVPGQGYDFAKPTKIYAAAACGTPVIYAGAGESAAMVAQNNLGHSVDFEPAKVAEAMSGLLDHQDTNRLDRIEWVARNASLRTSGRIAAAEVLSVVGR